MFTRGNTKLGPSVYTFSIPARQTCPDATKICAKACYATKGRYRTHVVQKSLVANAALARRPDFDRRASAELITKQAKLVRVHPSGDLFSVGYATAWLRIMRSCPETTFWLYSRGWRNPKIRTVLKHMARLKNVRVWFSADADTGLPKNPPARVRVAWLMAAEGQLPPRPVDLVFRTKGLKSVVAETVPSGASTSPVCPTETGLPGAKDVTCETCKKCFEPLSGDAAAPTRFPLAVTTV